MSTMEAGQEIDWPIGAALAQARRAQGRSARDLAMEIGVQTDDLTRAEAGVRRLNARELFALSDTLAVPVAAFYARWNGNGRLT